MSTDIPGMSTDALTGDTKVLAVITPRETTSPAAVTAIIPKIDAGATAVIPVSGTFLDRITPTSADAGYDPDNPRTEIITMARARSPWKGKRTVIILIAAGAVTLIGTLGYYLSFIRDGIDLLHRVFP